MQPHTQEELSKDVKQWGKKGQTYTIRSIEDWDFVVGVRLEEIVNPPIYFNLVNKFAEPCFASWRFRKAQEDELEVGVEEFEKVY